MRKFKLVPFLKGAYRRVVGGTAEHGFGCMGWIDAISIYRSLDIVVKRFNRDETINICEVGVRNGSTARGIKEHLINRRKRRLEYWGVDNGADGFLFKPFADANMIWGNSEEVFTQVPDNMHWVFLDGCHCADHARLDIKNFGIKLVEGGVLVLHDVSTDMQGTEYQGHGDKSDPKYCIWVREPMKELLLNSDEWQFEFEDWQDHYQGGVAVFTKKGK